MLSRLAIEPIPHLAERLNDVKRVSKLAKAWGYTGEKQRRSASYRRFIMPVRLRLGLDKKKNTKDIKARSVVVRKVKKREIPNALEASHVWAAKRMKMEQKSWFGTSEASRMALRATEATVERALKGSGVHDLSYEDWFEIQAESNEDMTQVLSSLFDADDIPTATELSGTRYVMHFADSFPADPIGPVRILFRSETTVWISIHRFCSPQAMEALMAAIEEMQSNDETKVRRLESVYAFLVIGPDRDKVTATLGKLNENRGDDGGAVKADHVLCPISGTQMPHKAFDVYFFGNDFGHALTYGDKSLLRQAQSRSTKNEYRVETSAVQAEEFDFSLGVKQSLRVPCRLVMIEEPNSKCLRPVWTRLARAASTALGALDMEHLMIRARVPSFPRDFPDTSAYEAYWNHRCVHAQDEFLMRPKSKRGTTKHGPFRPEWAQVTGIDGDQGPIAVARGWHNVSFFFGPDSRDSELHPNLVVRVTLLSPRSKKFGARLRDHSLICLPTPDDYTAFCAASAKKWEGPSRTDTRDVLGLVSSSQVGPDESQGIGHITVSGLLRLLSQAEREGWKMKRKHLFVLIRDDSCPENGIHNWGVAFMSVAA